MSAMPQPTLPLGSVLVVGGCGFVGSHIVDQLLAFPSEQQSTPITDPATGQPDARFAVDSLRGRYPDYAPVNAARGTNPGTGASAGGTRVSVLDRRAPAASSRQAWATYYEADICDAEALLRVFAAVKPDVVVHTVSPPPLASDDGLLWRVNVEGTRTLLTVASGERGEWGGRCRAFVYTSSASVVHDTVSDLRRVDERWPYVVGKEQREYYTETKAHGEQAVLAYNAANPNGMLTTAIRPAGIFGERDMGVTGKLLAHGAQSAAAVLRMQLGSNDNLFDFTYVGNVALAHTLAAARLLATASRTPETGQAAPLDFERVDGEAFFVTNDAPVYFWDMAHALWALTGRVVEPDRVVALPEPLLMVLGAVLEGVFGLFGKRPRLTRREARYSCMTRYYSCDKAKRRLGYEPVVGMDEGVRRAAAEAVARDRGLLAKKTE